MPFRGSLSWYFYLVVDQRNLFIDGKYETVPNRNPSKPKSSSKLITNPISPETSTNENPMKAYRNNSSRCDGFLPMDISNEP